MLPLSPALLAFKEGSAGPRRATESLLARIRVREPDVQAWAALDEARALALAEACAHAAPDAPLAGVPFGVKDIIDTADLPTRCGSRAYADRRPDRDAGIVERIRRAGGFVLGKTHTTELAYMHPAPTRNPWNPAHTPGGSSAGSAAAVAAGFVPAAIGTQTNGSVIRPAAYCGVVGFKPTFGLLPMRGVLPFSETLDQLGTFAATVADCAFVTAPLADGDALPARVPRLAEAPRVGVLARYPWNDAEPEAAAHFAGVIERLAAAGARPTAIALPDSIADAKRVQRTIMLFEAARRHAPLQARARALLTPALNEGLDEGRRIAEADYRAALARRAAIAEAALDVFDGLDAIASPPAPGAAPASLAATGDPSFCTLWSLIGAPAITVPSGCAASGLPFGLQLASAPGEDARLLAVAGWCEAQFGFRGLA